MVIHALALLAVLLSGSAVPVIGDAHALPGSLPLSSADTVSPPAEGVRIFVLADAHSRHEHVAAFVAAANAGAADLVIDAGDMVHDGTEPELTRAFSQRRQLRAPWHLAVGNHDAVLRGPFHSAPPVFPSFEVVQHRNVRVVLLANHDARITPQQFEALEAELSTHDGAVHLVVMHVPPFVIRERGVVPLRRLLPMRFASPAMTEAAEVERFMSLVERHGVAAVIAGHTHAFDETERGGVRYFVVGTLGGFLPGLRIPHEYLVLTIEGEDIDVERVAVARGAREPVGLLLSAFRFLSGVNSFNHAAIGWSYTPSTSVQLRSGVVRRADGRLRSLMSASFERQVGAVGRFGVLGETGFAAGGADALLQGAAGVRLRVLGDYNRNVNMAALVRGGAGISGGRAGGEFAPLLGAGLEWRSFTLELQQGRGGRGAILIGRRY